MPRLAKSLTEPQTARARMRAGSGFEAEASITVTPAGLLAIGGLVAAILLSVPPIVRAARKQNARSLPKAGAPLLLTDATEREPVIPSQ